MFITKLHYEHLMSEISYLREWVEREKRRADLAVDRVLAKEVKVFPISPELNPIISESTVKREGKFQAQMEKVMTELETVGEDFGVDDRKMKTVIGE